MYRLDVATVHFCIQCDSNRYNNDVFPNFALPREIGHFSMDKDRKVILDKSMLNYYIEPLSSEVDFDLTVGFESFIDKNKLAPGSRKELLDPLLKFLLKKNGDRTLQPDNFKQNLCFGADFVCWRGALTKIGNSPFEKREPWKFAIIKVHGVIFMCELETEEKRRAEANMDRRGKIMCYGGFKFEQYVTSKKLREAPDTSQPVDTREQFCSVVRGKLGNNRILFGGETDCIDHKDGKYIELKTTVQHFNQKIVDSFNRFKAGKWWLQSFLIGIETIICGYRNSDGVVQKLGRIPVKSLAKNAIGWNPCTCLNFLESVLTSIKDRLTTDDVDSAFILEFEPNTCQIVLRNNTAQDAKDAHFLPEWFKEVL